MNPSFEAFVDPPDGFHEKPGTRSNREGQFSPPEAHMVVEPRIQLLGLCSFDARRKSRFLVFGAEKRRFFGAREEKKKAAAKYFWGVEKVIWPPNTITRRRRIFFFLKAEVFPLGHRKILLLRRPPKKPIFGFGRVKKKKAAEKKNWGAEKNYWWPKTFLGGSKKLFRRRTP